MPSNLPPGCSDRDIPGNRPEDEMIEKAIEQEKCEACQHYADEDFWCCDCYNQGGEAYQSLFEEEPDHAKILERLQR